MKLKWTGLIIVGAAVTILCSTAGALIDGTPHSVRATTREILDIMKSGGGYVAGASHDTILEETPLENVLAMFETVRESGVY